MIEISSYIWDTGALTLFFADHDEAKTLMREVKSGQSNGLVPSLILSEFYYKTWQKFGNQAAQVRTISLRENLLEILELENDDIFQIGELKIKNNVLSLADCVILTIAKRTKSTILTTDDPLNAIAGVKSKKLDF